MTPDQIKQIQTMLNSRGINVPVTGVMDQATTDGMNSAVSSSLSAHPNFASFSNGNSADSIVSSYLNGDSSGVNNYTGQSFTPAQQGQAVQQSTDALAPGFNEQKQYDTSNTTDYINNANANLSNSLQNNARNFSLDKQNLDSSAATNGVLYSGSRLRQNNNLASAYAANDRTQALSTGQNVADVAKNYQYQYGNNAMPSISGYYNSTPTANTYNTNTANGTVTPNVQSSSLYSPNRYNFQGTTVNANNAAVQTRAAGLLTNAANKLTVNGYNNKI